MLVLTRKHNETLHIGDDIVITIVRARGSSIRIGIEAPKDINIQRGELIGKPKKQVAAPQSPETTKKVGYEELLGKQPVQSEKPGQSGKIGQSESTAGSGPLSKFLKVFPKVELAQAS